MPLLQTVIKYLFIKNILKTSLLSFFIFFLSLFNCISYSCEETFNGNKGLTEATQRDLLNHTSKSPTTGILNQRISDYLDFSFIEPQLTKTLIRILTINKIVFIGDLIQKSEHEILGLINIGKVKKDIIKKALTQKGLQLGTILNETWTSPNVKTIPLEILNQKITHHLDFNLVNSKYGSQISRTLEKNNIVYIGQLIQKNEHDILNLVSMGKTQKDIIKKALTQKGLQLGTILNETWTSPNVKTIPLEILNKKITHHLDFSFVNSKHRYQISEILEKNNIVYIGDLIQKSKQVLLNLPGIGITRINELEEVLAHRELHLDTILTKPWFPPKSQPLF